MSEQRRYVEDLDPRYCPNWLTGVPHGVHEYRYEFLSSEGEMCSGAYYCKGVHSARFPAVDVGTEGGLL